MKALLPYFLVLLFGLSNATANDLEDDLRDFKMDSKEYMQRNPRRYDSNDVRLPDGSFASERFSKDAIKTKSFIKEKVAKRPKPKHQSLTPGDRSNPSAGMPSDNDPKDLVDNPNLIDTLEEMEKRELRVARLKTIPWSADYWPYARGILASRAFNANFMDLEEWKERFDFITNNPFFKIFETGDVTAIDQLSVAEKYDLLVGSKIGALTQSMWRQGKVYYDEKGTVEPWMGICHGWAPASYMVDRPEHSVSVKAFDGKTDLVFYPDEIKALSSYVWANEPFPTKFIGGRCGEKEPKVDSLGRATDAECLDTNPGTWHLSVVNQIALSQRSFIMDATYDYEVWNQPVIGYKYVYFNPDTGKEVANLAAAKVAAGSFNDKFAKFRSPRTETIVGVSMRVGYMIESAPEMNDKVSADEERIVWVDYLYDLEIDKDGHILGGEWYSNKHPDFLWTPEPNAKAQTLPMGLMGSWDGQTTLPESWMRIGQAGGRSGVVLSQIVDVLLAKSRE